MRQARLFLLFTVFACALSASALQNPQQLDLTNPNTRKMILDERKGMDCAGLYQQTKLKLDAQLKLGSKLDTSSGISSQTMATMTELTTALGQHRRELCEFYKHDPSFTKEDYFRGVGDLEKGESDAALLFQYASGKAPKSALQNLQTVKPQATSNGSVDVNATLKSVVQTVDSVTTRLTKAEQKLNDLETKSSQLEPTHQSIATVTSTVEVTVESNEKLSAHYFDSGGYLAFAKGSTPVLVTSSQDCYVSPKQPGQLVYKGVFNSNATDQVIGQPISVLKNAEYIQIGFTPMAPDLHIIGGTAVVVINNAVTVRFAIPPQTAQGKLIFIRSLAGELSELQ